MKQIIFILSVFLIIQFSGFAQKHSAYFKMGESTGNMAESVSSVKLALENSGFKYCS